MTTSRPGLRTRRREETMALVRAVADRHLAEHGAAALSLRAVAREVGMAVSNLYRYFPSRDDLVTDLLVRAYESHALAVEEAAAPHLRRDEPMTALRAAFTAYRRWALERPAEFGLAYGAPVPGYHAPTDRTLRAGTRIGGFLIGLLVACDDQGLIGGEVVAARLATLSPATTRRLETLRATAGYHASIGLIAIGVDSYVRLHGCISMEVFGQLRYVAGDDDDYFRESLDQEFVRCGMPPERV